MNQPFQCQLTSNAIRRLFYSPMASILSAENRLATWVLEKKWPRMHQILHFSQLIWGESLSRPSNGEEPLLCWCDYHYLTAIPSLPLCQAFICPCSNGVAVFYRPAQLSCCLQILRGRLPYSLLKRLMKRICVIKKLFCMHISQ